MTISTTQVGSLQATMIHKADVFLAGRFSERVLPEYTSRNFEERGFTVGIGGYATTDGV